MDDLDLTDWSHDDEWADGYLHAHYGNTSAPWPKDEIPDPPEVQP